MNPERFDVFAGPIEEGLAKAGGRQDARPAILTSPRSCWSSSATTSKRAVVPVKAMLALYVGGMGARDRNFYNDVAVRLGYEAEAKKVQDLYLDGKKEEATAAIPTKLVEDLALIGPEEKIRDELDAWRESIATTLLIGGDAAMIRRVAELVKG